MTKAEPKIGAHLPIGKGLEKTADEAVRLGLEALQIFVRNPRGSGARQWSGREVDYFRQTLQNYHISPLVVHIPYTVNPASVRDDLYEFARHTVAEDLKRCQLLGADYLVLHPGSYAGSSPEQGIERVSSLLNQVLEADAGSTLVLLETMAGQGSELGRDLAELRQIITGIKLKERMGICFDTCHTFAAGYQWQEPQGTAALLKSLDDSLGRDVVKLIHANDSEKEAGSRKDRHAPIGQGEIGLDGFRALMQEPFFKSRAFILETPFEGLAHDVETIKKLRQC